MRLGVDKIEIDVQSWLSKDQLVRYLNQFALGLLLGESNENEKEFYSATFRPIPTMNPAMLAVGVCSEGHGISPEALLISTELCLFGYNSEIAAIKIATGQLLFRRELDFLFHSLIPVPALNLILVMHETGAVAITTSGEPIWEFSRDVVEKFYITSSTLYLKFMDSEPATLELVSGRERARA